jgi:hypothetical protein
MAILASPIDLANSADFGGNGVFNLRTPIWQSGSALYSLARLQLFPDRLAIYKSTDDGNTWTEMDAGNAPPDSSTCNNFVDGDTCYVLVGPRSDQGDLPLRLYSFDCSSDSWTAIDLAGTAAHFASAIYRLSSGDFVIAYGNSGAFNLILASISGGVWTDIQDLIPLTAAQLNSYTVYGCLDQDERTHIFFGNRFLTLFWHASVESSLALGTVDALPAVTVIGGAVAVGDATYLSCTFAGGLYLVVGTPNAAPVFTPSGEIDGNAPDTSNVLYDSGLGVLAVVSLHSSQTKFLLAQTTDLAGLTDFAKSTIYDVNTDQQPPDYDPLGIFPAGLNA